MVRTFTVLIDSGDGNFLKKKKKAVFEACNLNEFKAAVREYVDLDDFDSIPDRIKLKLS